MTKIKVDKKSNTVTITLPLIDPPRESKSGNTKLIASTGNNRHSDLEWEGKPVQANVSLFFKP